jgi:para-aminobenzoate synthetase/4-amino-4-deoxychorismate lyase
MEREYNSPLLIFDFVDKLGNSQRRTFSNPVRIISTNSVEEVRSALTQVQELVNQGHHAAGYISYEAAPAFDAAYTVLPNHKMPLLWFGIFDQPDTNLALLSKHKFTIAPWESDTSPDRYIESIRKIKHDIALGNTYQVNYTMRLRSHFEGDDLGYYESLRNLQRTNYSAYLNIGRFRILSLSPELFFNIDGKTITTSPMKGTIQRGRWLEEDMELASWLSTSEKDQAENVMIVDLMRNDLSKIPSVISVQVPQLFEIERYQTVYQMTSTIEATVAENISIVDVLDALFPCGSITGAPKISTMRIISELEHNPREIYCGTIGIMEPTGGSTFNVAIRSVLLDDATGVAEYGIGGGVTWDSTSNGEFAEAFAKASFLEASDVSFELLETLKLKDGEYAFLHRHLTRLAASAKFFDIPIDLGLVTHRLQEHANQSKGTTRRVRLLVSTAGEIRVESSLLNELSQDVETVALANTPVSKKDRFLYHKTTRRDVYEHHQNEHPNVFDVLLWNEAGQITEFTNGNIVLEIDGKKVTPSRDCGLLAGTFRAHLLDEGIVEEAVVTHTDVARATNLWFINSVRGWVSVRLSNQTVHPSD